MFKQLKNLLNLLDKEFPYSTMNKDFKGKHGITNSDSGITIAIWYKDLNFPVYVSELDLENIDSFVKNTKKEIEEYFKNKK